MLDSRRVIAQLAGRLVHRHFRHQRLRLFPCFFPIHKILLSSLPAFGNPFRNKVLKLCFIGV